MNECSMVAATEITPGLAHAFMAVSQTEDLANPLGSMRAQAIPLWGASKREEYKENRGLLFHIDEDHLALPPKGFKALVVLLLDKNGISLCGSI